MPNEIDALAARLADVFHRETEHRKVKWGHLTPEERGIWRLIARVAARELDPLSGLSIKD